MSKSEKLHFRIKCFTEKIMGFFKFVNWKIKLQLNIIKKYIFNMDVLIILVKCVTMSIVKFLSNY